MKFKASQKLFNPVSGATRVRKKEVVKVVHGALFKTNIKFVFKNIY